VIANDVFTDEKMTDTRPYVVISKKEEYPVSKQYNAMVVTSNDHDGQAIPLSDADLIDGDGFDKQSFACPWATTPLKQRDIERRVGALERSVVKQLVQGVKNWLSVPETTTVSRDASAGSAINAEG
jgi:hypothetical protein